MEASVRARMHFVFLATLLILGPVAMATIFGNVRGIVHDPQHRPVSGADVKLKSATSDWSQATQSGANGDFTFSAVPLGDYVVTVSISAFATSQESVTVVADSSPVVHFMLQVASVSQTTTVNAQAEVASADSISPTTLVNREDIAQTPGA